MNFPDGLFGDIWLQGAWLLWTVVLLWSLRCAPWRRLGDNGQLNVLLGAIVALTLLWSMKAGVRPGLNLHFLGACALTLMFGRSLAMLALTAVLAAVTFNASLSGQEAWRAFALNAIVQAVFPVLVAHYVQRFVERVFSANIFIYIFGAAFFGAALTVLATGALSGLLLWWSGAYSAELLLSDYLPFFLLLAFAEAWLNGAAITLMVVYLPAWVGSFDDRRYLWGKDK